jgi:hypothetical protein
MKTSIRNFIKFRSLVLELLQTNRYGDANGRTYAAFRCKRVRGEKCFRDGNIKPEVLRLIT